ncbi:MAG TPA: choice-of-anchor D domain-containing protein, partial [Verrucomicrobiales bacterium]|nr:choice-of-anchor D domain-containing protein [Verrucomicrobiales bacterium]
TGDGQLNLTGISVVASGPVIAIFPPPPLPFRVEGAEPRIVLPGASTSCRVIFPATTAGAFEAMLVIQNNDADENPFSILLKASAEGDPVPPKEPEIAVSLDNADLPMGAAVDFGRTPLTVPVKKTITISNKGTATLNVRAGFLTALRGNLLNIPFRLAGEPFSSVAPGASKALSVVFQPVTAGKYEAMLIVTNNDKDENPYRLKLTGQGGTDPAAVPDIGLKLGDADLAMNALVDFGVAVPGSSVTKEIRILNSGAGELKLGRISFSAATAAGGAVNVPGADGALLPPVGALPFRALLPPNNVVPPGGSAVLRLVYMAPASGTQQVGLSIESNDPDESPWLLKLKGASSGTPPAPAEISVSAGGADLPIGGKLEFGDVVVGSPVRREIAVTNSGTGELRITGFSILPAEATANNALLFLPPNALVRVVSGPGTIAPGKSAGYVLEMMGFTAGPADFNARISSNDADENPYTFKVTGVIVAPPNPGNGGEGDPASPAGAIGN